MRSWRSSKGFMGVLALALALVLVPGFTPSAWAATEDAALFYEELAQYGTWLDYENYGPVWHPNKVEEGWRPYVNGRWVPTEQGYIFETDEAWGWATYHYGNWMPTEAYGWVWVPGRTWYPNTVAWKTSPEGTPAEDSYVAWAPIPPPDYVPPPAYAPPGGYITGSPVLDLITAPFWIAAAATSFLLGLGQPFIPAYSYGACGCLAPYSYYPAFFPSMVLLSNWCYPSYYPPIFLGLGFGAYAFGPPFGYFAPFTNININVFVRNIHIHRIHNTIPPRILTERNRHLKQTIPPRLLEGKALAKPQPVKNVEAAKKNLGRPDAVKRPTGLKPLAAGKIPKASAAPPQAGQPVKGMGLPPKAAKPITPKMADEIKKAPAHPTPKPPEVGAKPGVKPEAKPGVKPEGKAKALPEGKPGFRPESKPGMRPEVRPLRPEAKPGVRPESKPGFRPEGKPGMQPEIKPGMRPAQPPRPQPQVRPQAPPQQQPQVRPQAPPQQQPQVRPQAPPQQKPQHQEQPQQQKQLHP